MNWGYKIITVYVIFVLGILFLVFKSFNQNQDLVTNDYYEQELRFQDKIEETQRANKLSTIVSYEIKGNELLISFPNEMKGKNLVASVLLYCTADKSKDTRHEYHTKDAKINFPIPAGNKGLHELKIDWIADNVPYYFQHKIMIP